MRTCPPERLESTEHWFLDDSYEDLSKGKVSRSRPSIHAQTIKENHIRLFVPYLPSAHESTFRNLCPDLKPGYFTGLKLRGGISAGEIVNSEANTKDLLDCAKQLWRVNINDSIYTNVNFRFYHHPDRNQDGLLAIIPIHHLDKTEHFIKIDKQRLFDGEEPKWFNGQYLWFYKY